MTGNDDDKTEDIDLPEGMLVSDEELMEEEKMDEDERFRKLDEVWDKLKDVDRMILECYYWEGCKMEEIAQRIGYKSGDSVKSRKNKVLRKIMDLMQEGADFSDLPNAA